eukprot:m51a1_g7457 putative protein serine threonine (1052) ;mRNA; r:133285-137077
MHMRTRPALPVLLLLVPAACCCLPLARGAAASPAAVAGGSCVSSPPARRTGWDADAGWSAPLGSPSTAAESLGDVAQRSLSLLRRFRNGFGGGGAEASFGVVNRSARGTADLIPDEPNLTWPADSAVIDSLNTSRTAVNFSWKSEWPLVTLVVQRDGDWLPMLFWLERDSRVLTLRPGSYTWHVEALVAHSATRSFTITGLCGNSRLDAGEECDGPLGCSDHCKCEDSWTAVGKTWCMPSCSSAGCSVCIMPQVCLSCNSGYEGSACNKCTRGGVYPHCKETVPSDDDHSSGGARPTAAECAIVDATACHERGCSWCPSEGRCQPSPDACAKCGTHSDQRSCAQPCRWCPVDGRCVEPNATCTASCAAARDKTACDAALSCMWIGTWCVAANRSVACADIRDSGACASAAECAWCDKTLVCVSKQDPCSKCAGLGEESCAAASDSCAWCSARSACYEQANICPDCTKITNPDVCASSLYSGCLWCNVSGTCIESDKLPSSAECDCGPFNRTQCGVSNGCHWCSFDSRCYPKTVQCVPCTTIADKARAATHFRIAGCANHDKCGWDSPTQKCIPEMYLTKCTVYDVSICNAVYVPGCETCDGKCSSSCSSGGTSAAAWAVPLALVLALAAVAAVLAVLFVQRRRRRQRGAGAELHAMTLPFAELACARPVRSAEEAGLRLSRTAIDFGDPLDVGKQSTAMLEIENMSGSPVELAVHLHDAPEDYKLAASDARLTIGAGCKASLVLFATPACTTSIRTDVALSPSGSGVFVAVPVRAEVKPSTVLSWSELEIKSTLGRGAMGVVYAGVWRGQPVAVKEVKADMMAFENCRESVVRELELLSKLRSPYVVCFYGAVLTSKHTALVMELCPLGDLASLVQKGPLEPLLKLKIVEDISRGMNILHENGIIHRDLKPENVLMVSLSPTDTVRVKLSDFGESRAIGSNAEQSYTKAVGTPVYMAPEVLDGKVYGPKADVYSYGVLLWFVETRQIPYKEFQSSFAISAFVCEGRRLEVPECPLRSVIERCWAQASDDRPSFAAITELICELISTPVANT